MSKLLDEGLEVDEGYDAFGVHSELKVEDGVLHRKLTYDAQPMLDAAAEKRAVTAGERWGEMRHVGIIPMAEVGKCLQMGNAERQVYLRNWLKANPLLVTFDKFLLK